MNQSFLVIFISMTLLFGCKDSKNSSDKVIEKQTDSIESSTDWIVLFDGTSLDGWRAYNGNSLPPGWSIKDKAMVFSTEMIQESDYDYKGSRDIIYAAEEFENFEFYVEWKIPPGGNSGIFYHAKEGYPGLPVVAPEYQIIDDINYTKFHDIKEYNESIGITKNPHELQLIQSTGADYGMYEQIKSKVLNPAGEWNSTKIRFTLEKVEYFLNDKKLLEFIPWSKDWNVKKQSGKWNLAPDYGIYKKGYIGFQDHGSSLSFRNIKIKKL